MPRRSPSSTTRKNKTGAPQATPCPPPPGSRSFSPAAAPPSRLVHLRPDVEAIDVGSAGRRLQHARQDVDRGRLAWEGGMSHEATTSGITWQSTLQAPALTPPDGMMFGALSHLGRLGAAEPPLAVVVGSRPLPTALPNTDYKQTCASRLRLLAGHTPPPPTAPPTPSTHPPRCGPAVP